MMKGKKYAIRQAKKLLLNANNSLHGEETKSNGYATDVESIASFLDINIHNYEFSDSISGVFFKKDGKLYLGVNSTHHENRQRFTIAHEIGHYILHSEEILHYDGKQDVEILFRADNISNLNEIEANYFAAELLMPENKISKLINEGVESISELASTFEVSEDAMRYRLINLGYL